MFTFHVFRVSQETAAYGELQLCLESQLTVLGNLPFHTQLGLEEVLQEEELVLEEAEHQIHPSKQQKVIDLEESGGKNLQQTQEKDNLHSYTKPSRV